MKKIIVIGVFYLSILTNASDKNCTWCLSEREDVFNDLKKLSKLSPKEQLNFIKNQKTSVIVLKSHQKVLAGTFNWGKFIKPHNELKSLSSKKALMGKTLCKGEHMFSDWQDTIALSDVAPRSTLIHEYIHILQLRQDKEWCPLSKKLWSTPSPSQQESQAIRNKEWDAHKILWKLRSDLAYDIEDEIAISSETLEEAKMRKEWDPQAIDWVKSEDIELYMNHKIQNYMNVRVKKK
ncbi:MAG: hypothetical protein KA116_00460 [Proteobacteria bacterium]|nr:hypothetical protein [Pseudomonadota bacterium]